MTNKFSIDEKVEIIGQGVIGVVQQIEEKIIVYQKVRSHSIRYLVQHGAAYNKSWYDEKYLKTTYHLSKEQEININKLLIDLNLKNEDYKMCKILQDEINQIKLT